MTAPGEHDFAVVGTRLVHQGRVVALRVDDVRMPGGRVARREVVEHLGAVAVLALDDQDRVAMIKQYRHPVGDRIWELPAGLLDAPGEDPVAAAGRELAEETGLSAQRWEVLVDAAASPGFTDEAVRVFLATGIGDAPRGTGEDDEEADIELRWVPLVEAVRWCLAGDVVNATTLAGLLALAAVRAGAAPTRPADAPWPGRPRAFADRGAARG